MTANDDLRIDCRRVIRAGVRAVDTSSDRSVRIPATILAELLSRIAKTASVSTGVLRAAADLARTIDRAESAAPEPSPGARLCVDRPSSAEVVQQIREEAGWRPPEPDQHDRNMRWLAANLPKDGEQVDLLAALQRSIERARVAVREPCPRCGGDRLMKTSTGDGGPCHAQLTACPDCPDFQVTGVDSDPRCASCGGSGVVRFPAGGQQ